MWPPIGRRIARERASPTDERVDRYELVNIVRDAAAVRNGWKRILARCAPPPPTRGEWLASLRSHISMDSLADDSGRG
jgi:hypothetical protein